MSILLCILLEILLRFTYSFVLILFMLQLLLVIYSVILTMLFTFQETKSLFLEVGCRWRYQELKGQNLCDLLICFQCCFTCSVTFIQLHFFVFLVNFCVIYFLACGNVVFWALVILGKFGFFRFFFWVGRSRSAPYVLYLYNYLQ